MIYTFFSFICVVRLFAQTPGTLDTSLDSDGIWISSFGSAGDVILDVALTPQNGIVCLGVIASDATGYVVMALEEDGTPDNSFGTEGFVYLSEVLPGFAPAAMTWDNQNRIVLAGSTGGFQEQDVALARLLINGDVDLTFDLDGMASFSYSATSDVLRSVVVDSQGRIVACGDTFSGTITDQNLLVTRLQENGDLDDNFGDNGMFALEDSTTMEAGMSLKVNGDDEVLVGCYHFDTITRGMIVKLNSNGLPDVAFGSDGIRVYSEVEDFLYLNDLAMYPDGRIAIAGASTFDGDASTGIMRLLENGDPDPDFASNGLFAQSFTVDADIPQELVIQPDGKIVAGGEAHPNGSGSFFVFRLNADGSVDAGFGTNGVAYTEINFYSSANAMAQSEDGRIVLAGLQLPGGNYDFAVARYHGGAITSITQEVEDLSMPIIYPNPCKDSFAIRNSNNVYQTLAIYNSNGQLVYSQNKINQLERIDTSTWPKGIYCATWIATDSREISSSPLIVD